MKHIATLATLLVVLAGCADGGSAPTTETPPGTPPPPPVEAGLGLIRGVVIDSSITPIPEATVTIKSIKATLTTDANGFFQFPNLEPGTYFLEVSKLGFTKVQASTTVAANVKAPEMVKVQLEAKPEALPRAVTLLSQGYIGCSFLTANFVWGNMCQYGGIDPDQNIPLSFGEAERPTHLQTEIDWEKTQVFGEDLVIIQYLNNDAGGRARIGNVFGKAPLVCSVGPDAPCDNGDGTGGGGTGLNGTEWTDLVNIAVFAGCWNGCVPGTAVGVGVVAQQEYQMYGTVFYNMVPDEGWAFVRDSFHPVPGS